VDLNLQSIWAEVTLCIEAAMGPVAGHRSTDICCRWCLVMTKIVVAVARTGDDVAGLVFVVAEVVAAEALALTLSCSIFCCMI
jgi:hypothetical protein